MQEKERIKVYIQTAGGKTVCMCMRSRKGCDKPCEKDVVTRDRYEDWKSTMCRNKYGR